MHSSSSSTSSFSSSSSSFGDAIDLLYFVDKNGNLYLLKSDAERIISSLVFNSFSPISNPPCGLSIAQFISEESSSSSGLMSSSSSSFSSASSSSESTSSISENSSSSSSSSNSSSSLSSSESSESTVNYEYNVYILRKKNTSVANVEIRDMTGFLRGSIDFSSGFDFLGMSIWPGNNNLLLAISENYLHLLYISSGQIGVYSFKSPVSLTYGISLKSVIDENSAEFFVRSKDNKEIVSLIINKKYRYAEISNRYKCYLSKWNRRGGMSYQPEVFFLIKKTGVLYTILEESSGYSYVYETGLFDTADSSTSSSSPLTESSAIPEYSQLLGAIPMSIYSSCVPVDGSTAISLVEPEPIPEITMSLYDIDGNFKENFKSLFMGNMKPNSKSNVSVIKMRVSGVGEIYNLKLGIIKAEIGGNLVENTIMYGVHSTIDSSVEITDYFPGINQTALPDDLNNIEVGINELNTNKYIESNYVYLAINVPQKYLGRGVLILKWFFDYE